MSLTKQQLREMLEQDFDCKVNEVEGCFVTMTTNKLFIIYHLRENEDVLEISASGDPILDSQIVDAKVFCNEYKSAILQPYFLEEDKSLWTKFSILTKECSLLYIMKQISLAHDAINDFFEKAKQIKKH